MFWSFEADCKKGSPSDASIEIPSSQYNARSPGSSNKLKAQIP